MKLKHLTLFLIYILLASCKSIISLTENVNEKNKFITKEIYISKIINKTKFLKEKIYVIDDDFFSPFLNEIISKHLSTFYGITNNQKFVSADQLSVKSCSGQIINLYSMFLDNSKDIRNEDVTEIKILSKLNLDNTKNTIIFLYSYKLGGLYKTKISSVIKELEGKNNFDYRIISIDNYDILKK